MTRLEASVVAGKQGTDELNAFKRGFKKEGDDDLNEEQQDEIKRKEATQRKTMTNRNTQRNKNKNKLEMEVEKDLTNLKKLLMKKKEQKKLADKENQ